MNLYPVQCDLAIRPLSLNKLLRMSRWTRQGWVDTLAAMLDVAVSPGTKNALVADQRKKKVSVTVFSLKEMDRDNLVGGTEKVLYDALKKVHYIVDDSPQWVDRHMEQQIVKDKREVCLRVRIEEA